MKKIFLAILISIFIPELALAAPSISGVSGSFVEGSAIKISGNSLGIHSLNIEWLGGKDGLIETSPAGEIPVRRRWYFDSQWADTTIAVDQAHSGERSLKSITNNSNKYNGDIRYDNGSVIPGRQYIFISWWVRRVHVGSGQWKMFRIDPESDITDDAVQTVLFNWDTQHQWIVRFGPSLDTNSYQDWDPPFPTQDNRWYRIDYLIYTSAVGVADGSYALSLYDPNSDEAVKTVTHNGWETTYSNSYLYRWFLWQNYTGNGIASQTTWTDDIYVQVGTQARIELGDKDTWPDCTHREIQIPTAWSQNSITISANQGAFQTGQTAYLYVVDANGEVNANGYPVTIGGGGEDTIPPMSPSGLMVK